MEFEYNKDWKVRDNMLNVSPEVSRNGRYDILRFDNMPADILQKMVDLRFADPDERQNDSPSIGEILEFLKENPNFTAFGYAVTVERPDYRISIEGVESSDYDPRQIANFVDLFRFADEFEVSKDYQRAWFD